jgi:hypothetical protein
MNRDLDLEAPRTPCTPQMTRIACGCDVNVVGIGERLAGEVFGRST